MPEAQTRAYYDAFSETYEQHRHRGYHAMLDDMEVEVATPFVRGKEVLELGCGTGLILQRLNEHAATATGIDLSPKMAAIARHKGLDVHVGSVTALPFADASFDVVCSFKVLPHVSDISAALEEAARVTRPGGHLILEFYNRWSLRYAVKSVAGPQSIGALHDESHVHTRWDSPSVISGMLPPNVKLLNYYGIRVLTPFAAVHNVPGVATVFRAAERVASRSRLRYFGGFLVVVLQRDDKP